MHSLQNDFLYCLNSSTSTLGGVGDVPELKAASILYAYIKHAINLIENGNDLCQTKLRSMVFFTNLRTIIQENPTISTRN
jgi:hypothetical protein